MLLRIEVDTGGGTRDVEVDVDRHLSPNDDLNKDLVEFRSHHFRQTPVD
jgi:hypothetical protein